MSVLDGFASFILIAHGLPKLEGQDLVASRTSKIMRRGKDMYDQDYAAACDAHAVEARQCRWLSEHYAL